MIDNQQKYLNYKEQFRRLNRAISNGYNLEAMFITYFIIEDRTKAILIHMGKVMPMAVIVLERLVKLLTILFQKP